MSTPESPIPSFGIRLSALSDYMPRPGQLQGVSFWPRAAARIIDLIVHYIVASASGFLFGLMLAFAANGHPSRLLLVKLRAFNFMSLLLIIAGSTAYGAICESLHGSTLGKLLFSMSVVQEDGAPCRFGSALIRSLAYFVDGLFFGLVGYFAMQDDEQHQRFGDRWAQTIVCNRSEIAPENRRDGVRFIAALLFAFMADSALVMIALLVKINA
jgi:uncharacterized RDD family membrane protein YckC